MGKLSAKDLLYGSCPCHQELAKEATAGSSPLPKGSVPLGHRTAPRLRGDMGTGPPWPVQGAPGQECGPMAGDMLGVGVFPIALPVWDPLALLTSCRLVLCPCRLAGAWSYRCHCDRLPPGYVCACGLGRHHAEKVLGLLNSIKDFSVTQPASLLPSAAPAPHLPGAPWGEMLPRIRQRALQPLRWAAKLHLKVLFALRVWISWVHAEPAGWTTAVRRDLRQ